MSTSVTLSSIVFPTSAERNINSKKTDVMTTGVLRLLNRKLLVGSFTARVLGSVFGRADLSLQSLYHKSPRHVSAEANKSLQRWPKTSGIQLFGQLCGALIGGRYDWTSGGPDDGMNGWSTASYPARTPCVPSFMPVFHRFGSKGGWINFAVRWNLCPAILGIDLILPIQAYDSESLFICQSGSLIIPMRRYYSSGNKRAVLQKGGFGECTLVPVCGTIVPFLYPRSCFWGPSFLFFVLLFRLWGSREHPQKLPLETTLLWTPEFWFLWRELPLGNCDCESRAVSDCDCEGH